MRFPRASRLTRDADLRRVAREGKRIRTQVLEIRAAASPFSHPRAGFIVPKYSRTSVARNRLKRRLREIVRTELLPYLTAGDLVVRARREAYDASFGELHEQLVRSRERLSAVLDTK
ncbi:MAG TPA: ribonuclease P protein component [Gemmatimonadaceae bacterium]|nr:ribonuclease P protein component [Gemmatimonadaceae bacterium]